MALAMSLTVLVTGASGFVGTALVPLLLRAGYRVRVLTRRAASSAHDSASILRRQEANDVVIGDLANALTCQQAVAGVDVVIHLAGLAHTRATAAQHRQQNLVNTQQLADAAVAAGVQRFVYISSCKARYPAHSPYGYFKQASEAYLLALAGAMGVVCLRPGIIYGPGMRNNLKSLLAVLSRPRLPCFINATNTISMIGLDDCCAAIAAAVTAPALVGRVWDVQDGTPYSLQPLVAEIRGSKGLPVPRYSCPRWLLWLGLAVAQLLPQLRRRGLGLTTYQALYHEHYPVNNAFADASGWSPRTTFYQQLPRL
jgi:nucleoside-diphosphate-sugar epimerase